MDDPNGLGTTTINGVNDLGQLVGFYVDANGNTDGFVATRTANRLDQQSLAISAWADPGRGWPERCTGRGLAGPAQRGGGDQVDGSGPPYQSSMMCLAIDTDGGSASSRAWMAASSSSRLNQCASASSS